MFLSGSFRTAWEKEFQQCMGVIPILRESTVVPIQATYSIYLRPDHEDLYYFTMNCYTDIIDKINQSPAKHFKCMVFVPLVYQVEQVIKVMQERFGCSSNAHYASAELVGYTSRDTPEKQMSSYQRWIRGSGVCSVFV